MSLNKNTIYLLWMVFGMVAIAVMGAATDSGLWNDETIANTVSQSTDVLGNSVCIGTVCWGEYQLSIHNNASINGSPICTPQNGFCAGGGVTWAAISGKPAGFADDVDNDTTCDGGSCSIANTGTLDGYEAAALLDNTDDQTLSYNTGTYILSIESGNSVNLSTLSGSGTDTNCSAVGSCSAITYDSELDYYTDADIDGTETAFNGWDKNASDDFDGSWSSLTGIPAGFADGTDADTTYTHLSNFTDDLGARGYTHLSNFTNDIGAGSGGASNFTNLTDTPADYTGYGEYIVRVNAGETGLEYVQLPVGNISSFYATKTTDQTYTTQAAVVSWDSPATTHSDYTFDTTNGILQFNDAAPYLIQFDISTQVQSGTGRSQSSTNMQLNTSGSFADVSGTTRKMYNRMATYGGTSAPITYIHQATAGDQIRFTVTRDAGSDTVRVEDASLTVIRLTGVKGADGAAGATGATGADGADGEIGNNTAGWNLTFLTLQSLDWSNVSLTESQISDLSHYSDSDIDGTEAAFSGWDKNAADDFDGAWSSLSGVPAGFSDGVDNDTVLSEAQVDAYADNNGYLTSYTETDPSWSNNYTNGYNKTAWDTAYGWGDHSGLYEPAGITESDISDLNHYTDVDIDGTEAAFAGWDKDSGDDFDGAWSSLSGVPAGFSDGVDNNTQLSEAQVDAFCDNNGYLTSYTETDPTWAANYTNGYNKTAWDTAYSWGDHSGLYEPAGITESDISDLNHYSDSDIDGSESAFTGWDKNAADDFDGAFSSLTGTPAGLADGDDDTTYTNGTGLSLTGTTFSIMASYFANWNTAYGWGDHAGLYEPAGITESDISDLDHYTDADIDGTETAFSAWDKNASDDFDGAWSSLTGVPAGFSDGTDDGGNVGNYSGLPTCNSTNYGMWVLNTSQQSTPAGLVELWSDATETGSAWGNWFPGASTECGASQVCLINMTITTSSNLNNFKVYYDSDASHGGEDLYFDGTGPFNVKNEPIYNTLHNDFASGDTLLVNVSFVADTVVVCRNDWSDCAASYSFTDDAKRRLSIAWGGSGGDITITSSSVSYWSAGSTYNVDTLHLCTQDSGGYQWKQVSMT